MADVFISYKSERRAAAEHLAEILADYGYSVWWDYGLVSGGDFGAQIEKELRAAKAVVVLWCSLSVRSEWVREEAALAKRLNKLVPTFIEKVDLPLGFTLSQTLNLSDWDGAPQSNRLDRLLRDVATLAGRASKPDLEGLERTERAWRRFGAPPLREFALIDALERKVARMLPADLLKDPAPNEGDSNAGAQRQESEVAEHAASKQVEHAEGRAAQRSRWAPAGVIVAATAGFGLLIAAFVSQAGRQGPPPASQREAPARIGVSAAPEEFDDCSGAGWCPGMVVIPAGVFTIGSPPKEAGRKPDEGPQRDVSVAPFAVSKYEVTFAQWDACILGGGCSGYRPSDQGWGRGNRPVINVSWNDAQAYVQWLSERTGRRYRLLTEAEWEYAARARTTTTWSWGSDPNGGCRFANGADQAGLRANRGWTVSTCDDGVGFGTAVVGSYQANEFGLHDLHGNVWEWVQDCYVRSYAGLPTDGAAYETTSCSHRVFRGGSWLGDPQRLRVAFRYGIHPTFRVNDLGFRVARTP